MRCNQEVENQIEKLIEERIGNNVAVYSHMYGSGDKILVRIFRGSKEWSTYVDKEVYYEEGVQGVVDVVVTEWLFC
jgi:hypothetical protein